MVEKTKKLLDELYNNMREIATLRSCAALLDWDERTYMPRNGSEHRGNQASLMAGMTHEKFVSPRNGEILESIINDGIKLNDDTI